MILTVWKHQKKPVFQAFLHVFCRFWGVFCPKIACFRVFFTHFCLILLVFCVFLPDFRAILLVFLNFVVVTNRSIYEVQILNFVGRDVLVLHIGHLGPEAGFRFG